MYVLFFLAWIIFNGNITVEIISFGVVIASVMFIFMCKFMDYSIKKEINVYKKSIWFLVYVVILLREIVKANLAIIPKILTVEEEMEPCLVTFKTGLKSDFTKMLLANSITLTPGTITVSLKGDEYTIHCLDSSLAEGLENSDFEKALAKLDGEV